MRVVDHEPKSARTENAKASSSLSSGLAYPRVTLIVLSSLVRYAVTSYF
ncbi:MAG: hypothetical protein IJQ08_01470 [Synergistaceae bacterium]|nr:hypothetical protein [Synergistaceae bacterium]